jgi:1-acyl-sn-glycerol-3-phosphate acyltransferase
VSQTELLRERRFAPFFWTQFLGAFNDNVIKNALIVIFTMAPSSDVVVSRDTLVNLASALLVLPFFLFSATAGQLAEKMDKARLMRAVKLMEIAIMALAALAFYQRSAVFGLALIFAMGVHSTLFGPAKFAILPQVLREDELVGGNGLLEMGTYAAILVGMLVGSELAGQPEWGVTAVSATMIGAALLGYATSRAIPSVPSPVPGLRIDPNFLAQTVKVIGHARQARAVWLSVLGNSWFWFVGARALAQMPGFVEDVLHGTHSVYTLLLVVFTIGVGTGSMMCERLSGKQIELGLVPFGSIGISFFAIDLFFASEWHVAPAEPIGPLALLADPTSWRILIDLAMLGAFGGLYSVPLNAIIQHRSDPEKRARIIAGNNIMNALLMVGAAAVAIVALGPLGLSIPELFLLAGLLNALVALYIYTLLPEFLFRFLVWILMHTMYRLRVSGIERIPQQGAALLVCNHVSYVDAMILSAACRRPIRFVMWWKIFEMPLLKWMFAIARAIPIAGRKEKPELMEPAFAEIARALEAGELVCIFPEGSLTADGAIAPFRPGVARILETTPVAVYPMALRGLWGSFFSRRDGPAMKKRPRRFRSAIELIVGDPIPAPDATLERLEAEVRELRAEAQ